MAALADLPSLQLIDLRYVTAADLEALLQEQVDSWKRELDWDFTASASLIRRFVEMQALSGYALISRTARGREPIGYSYYVCEEGKGLIGDLYVRRADATREIEAALVEAVLAALWQTPRIHRVESQLMMLRHPLGARDVPYARWLQSYPRLFLEAPAVSSAPARALPDIEIAPWSEAMQEPAARLIAHSYKGHIDSQINDQYRSAVGARRFLTNIVQYPGCGVFFGPGSLVAIHKPTGSLCGVSLASLVAYDAGHLTQVCVAPSFRSIGLGYELIRRSMEGLAMNGCRVVSLTVTSANESALRLYRNLGFCERRRFSADVWEQK